MSSTYTPLPPCTFERETMRAVCRAYEAMFADGWRAPTCYDAGTKAFLERNPETPIVDARNAVVLIIATASRDYPGWMAKGLRNVPYYRVPRENGASQMDF